LRTDAHLHRMLPDDSPEARSISVLARANQDDVWRRTKLVQELRARPREFYPGFLGGVASGAVAIVDERRHPGPRRGLGGIVLQPA
jgi:hypothetical protein